MFVLKLVISKINFRQAIFAFIAFVLTLTPAIGLNTLAQNSVDTSTKASLIIVPTVFDVRLNPFTINPSEIFKGETLIFKLESAVFENGSIASNLPCRITITSPDSSISILEGLTKTNGSCIYDTSLTLAAQGLTLISGDILKINSTLGQGTAFATVTYNGNIFTSNTDSYIVKAKTLILGDFVITPNSIHINGNLIFQLNPVKYIDGTIASNLPVTFSLTGPNGGLIVLSGVTDGAGKLIFDLSKSLPSQGIALVSGNLNDLNKSAGDGFGNAKIVYDGVTYNTNKPTYRVKNPIIVIPPIPPIQEIPKIVTTLIRSGGGVPFGIVIILFLGFVILMVRDSLKKTKDK
jgi:hypothetical protein